MVGEDVASNIISSTSHNIDIPPNKNNILSDIYTASITNSIFSNSSDTALDFEDEKLAKLLQKVDSVDDEISEKMCDSMDEQVTDNRDLTLSLDNDEKMRESQDDVTPENILGNSLTGRHHSWTDPLQDNQEVREEVPESEIVFQRSVSIRSVAIDNSSFKSLWNEKQNKSTINFKEVWERFQKSLSNKVVSQNIPEEIENPEGFEVISSPICDKEKLDELQKMVETLCRLSCECGLDSQGFLCKECKSPLIDISNAKVCGFDGSYYCVLCMSKDKYAIPAKIIYNYDFTQYAVSIKAATFLSDYQFKPFIDFKVIILLFNVFFFDKHLYFFRY